MNKTLFAINPDLDRTVLAAQFAAERRVQIRSVLTEASALELRALLGRGTPWGLALRAPDAEGGEACYLRAAELQSAAGRERAQTLAQRAAAAAARGEYGYSYASYPLLDAYLQRWDPGGPHDILLEHLNTPEFLDLARVVTGFPDLAKADGQATLYAGGHFLPLHHDSHVAHGWKVAYVLNLASDEWRPDWGGYLAFYNEDGDIVRGYRPRFNALNLFAVPQAHSVTYVPPFAPIGRFAVTGWLRTD